MIRERFIHQGYRRGIIILLCLFLLSCSTEEGFFFKTEENSSPWDVKVLPWGGVAIASHTVRNPLKVFIKSFTLSRPSFIYLTNERGKIIFRKEVPDSEYGMICLNPEKREILFILVHVKDHHALLFLVSEKGRLLKEVVLKDLSLLPGFYSSVGRSYYFRGYEVVQKEKYYLLCFNEELEEVWRVECIPGISLLLPNGKGIALLQRERILIVDLKGVPLSEIRLEGGFLGESSLPWMRISQEGDILVFSRGSGDIKETYDSSLYFYSFEKRKIFKILELERYKGGEYGFKFEISPSLSRIAVFPNLPPGIPVMIFNDEGQLLSKTAVKGQWAQAPRFLKDDLLLVVYGFGGIKEYAWEVPKKGDSSGGFYLLNEKGDLLYTYDTGWHVWSSDFDEKEGVLCLGLDGGRIIKKKIPKLETTNP